MLLQVCTSDFMNKSKVEPCTKKLVSGQAVLIVSFPHLSTELCTKHAYTTHCMVWCPQCLGVVCHLDPHCLPGKLLVNPLDIQYAFEIWVVAHTHTHIPSPKSLPPLHYHGDELYLPKVNQPTLKTMDL